jgi:hypothetical protein
MAEVRKILGQKAPAAVTEEDLYVCSGATKQSVTSSVVVCNRSASASAAFRIAMVEDGTSPTVDKEYLYYDVVLLPNDTFVAQLGLTMNNLDTIRVYASTANLTFQVFGVEITP